MRTTLIHKPDLQRIDILDHRYYTVDGEKFYPGVTTILEVYPKGFGFNQWLKDVGNNAAEIVERAADQGSRVHRACETLAEGGELHWLSEDGIGLYSEEEWKMILRFKEFIDTTGCKILHTEKNMCSPELGYGGTIDLIVELGGKTWLIDIKTSNYLHTTHELQVGAYASMWNAEREIGSGDIIDYTGILWLKASTRTSKIDPVKFIYQGPGWQVKTFDRHYIEAFKIFQYTHMIWKEENPNYRPLNLQYPDRIKL